MQLLGRSPRRNRAVLPALLAVAVLLIVCLPAASAVSARGLGGEIAFTEARASGQTVSSSASSGTLHLLPMQGLNVDGWSLEADEAVVNWTRQDRTGVGTDPSNPNEPLFETIDSPQSSEDSFGPSSAAFHIRMPASSLLVAGSANTLVEVHASSAISTKPSPGEEWKVGKDAADTSVSPPGSYHPLQQSAVVAGGTPTSRYDAAEFILIKGAFSFYVWGVDVTMTPDDAEPVTYRSGSWEDSPGGTPTGPVIRNRHAQLVRITVADGQLTLAGWSGALRFSGSQITHAVEGKVVFEHADAQLRAENQSFVAQDQSFAIGGSLSMVAKAHQNSAAHLQGSLRTDSADTSLTPEEGPVPESVKSVDSGGNAPRQNLPLSIAPSSSDSPLVMILGVVGLLIIGLAVFVLLLRRRAQAVALLPPPAQSSPLLERAEAALVRGASQEARDLVALIVKESPDQADAWFVHGASLIHEGRMDQAIADIEPVAKRVKGNDSGLAFLLCLAHLRNGSIDKARTWSLVAAKEPEFREQMELDETFAPLAQKPAAKAPVVVKSRSPDVAYA